MMHDDIHTTPDSAGRQDKAVSCMMSGKKSWEVSRSSVVLSATDQQMMHQPILFKDQALARLISVKAQLISVKAQLTLVQARVTSVKAQMTSVKDTARGVAPGVVQVVVQVVGAQSLPVHLLVPQILTVQVVLSQILTVVAMRAMAQAMQRRLELILMQLSKTACLEYSGGKVMPT
jgi:hypothetical protein